MSFLRAPLNRVGKRFAAILVIAQSMASPAHADGSLHALFASCAGRLSAEMEHQWLMQDPRAEVTEEHRARMIALTELVTPASLLRQTLHRRIEAKAAHRALLQRAAFGRDPADAQWALKRAETEVGRCLNMLLS